jgi:photosystem II stability/assembly factor-like uncharacterized protein
MTRYWIAALAALAISAAAPSLPARAQAVPVSFYQDMHWRTIGPLRGGRTVAATGSPDNPNLFYIAAVNGGVWKSDDAGRTWSPIFDGGPTGSFGALAVAWSDPKTIYAGSGEGLQRPDLAVGDGIYKSTDAGATWSNVGLRDAQQIGSMAVDPHDPNRVFVAALGHPYGPNEQRGIFRTIDGGATWERVLYKNPDVGAFGVVIDPSNSKTVYATLWAARQAPWEVGASFEIPGSGVFKSTDGGTTWAQLSDGLPARVGRCEIAVAPSAPNVVYVYADQEAKGDDSGTVYRSDDGGAHFKKVDDAANIAERGDDLISLAVDPQDPHTVYLTNTSTYKSTDGGMSFTAIRGAPGGDDYHTAWVNPANPKIVLLASDQGAVITVNGGRTWSSWFNQPTAQMYHVNTDDRFPYRVCGGQQESGSACVLSRGPWGETTMRDWWTVGAEEYGYVVPDPLHAGSYFGGKVEHFQESTGGVQEVSPIVSRDKTHRVVRTEPLAFDHFDKHLLYFGSNVVWTTRDGGHSWKSVSPDLTRAHPGVPAVLGPFETDDPQSGAHRGVVYALAPSYKHAGTVWAGTDDGQIWITRNGGTNWNNITPPQLTPWSKVAQIEASRVDDDTAFVAVTRFRLDDLHPYVYVTHDGGATWTLSVTGLPVQPVNAVRQDPNVSALLYAATENGVYVSFNGGARWQQLQLNLPHTSVRDAVIHGDDLVVATHGRGFWILDDVTPLRQIAQGAIGNDASHHFFAPANAYRVRRSYNTDTPLQPDEPTGENPPDGAMIDYWLSKPASHVTLSIFDASNTLVRRFASDDPAPAPIPDLDKPAFWQLPFASLPVSAGMHRFVWNLREPPPRTAQQDLPISAVPGKTPRVPEGVLVVPGLYRAVLDVDGSSQSHDFTIVMDPRISMSGAQLRAQYEMAHAIAAMMNRAFAAASTAEKAGKKDVMGRMEGLNGSLAVLLGIVDDADAPPTTQAIAAFNSLRRVAKGSGQIPQVGQQDEP